MNIEVLITELKDELKEVLLELRSQRERQPNSGAQLSRHLTRTQVARYLSIAKPTVDDWTRKGKLKKHFIGKSVRFDRFEIDETLKSGSLSKYNGR